MSQNRKPGVKIIIYTGQYGDQEHHIDIPIEADLIHELSEPLEISDDSFSLMFRTLRHGLREPREDYITYRKRKLKMREDISKRLSAHIVKAFTRYFGQNDIKDGYSLDPHCQHHFKD